VLVAAIIIYFYPTWNILDPICTFFFSIIVIFTTVSVSKDCVKVLMEGVPEEIDMTKLKEDF